MKNVINWFEIPAVDLDRASRFWEAVLGTSLKRESAPGSEMAIFPHGERNDPGGALVKRGGKPSATGTCVSPRRQGRPRRRRSPAPSARAGASPFPGRTSARTGPSPSCWTPRGTPWGCTSHAALEPVRVGCGEGPRRSVINQSSRP